MPKLLSQTEVSVEWQDLANWKQVRQPKSARKRSSGVHLSGIIKYVLTELKLLDAEDLTDEMPLRMCVGMAMENWLVGLMPEGFVWQPGEWEMDGVFGTPDGFTPSPPASHGYTAACVEEIKGATWKSQRNYGDILKQKIWLWQLAGNCYAMSARFARLHIVWINGDYRPPQPKYCRYLLEFEQRELEEFWQHVVLPNKDKVVPEKH